LPNIPWNKGSVLNWLIHTMILDEHHTFPLYLGDDCSDEDAFFAVKNRGVGILVAARSRNTAAGFRLNDTNEVRMFIERVIARLRRLARPHPTS
jgi:trehalose-phosphatase